MDCSICLGKLGKNTKTLPCGHTFNYKCIKTIENMLAIQYKCPSCPLCRQEYQNNYKYNTRSNSLDYTTEIMIDICKLFEINIKSKNLNINSINIIKILDLFITHPRMVLSFGEEFKQIAETKIGGLYEDLYNKELNKGISNDLLTHI